MNRSSYFLIQFILILCIATAEMATAIYTPCLPCIMKQFDISEYLVQLTISINLLGIAISGPVYGPLSDCFGRRKMLRIGMSLFLIGSLFALLTDSIEVFIVARFFQGVGAGVAVVVSFAVVRDLFDEQKSAKVLSYMGMAIALSPGLAPVLGGYLTHHIGWRSCFVAVLVLGIVLIALLFIWMPETIPQTRRRQFSVKETLSIYKNVMQNKKWLSIIMIPSLMIAGIWVWMSAIPILFIHYLDVPVRHYGYYSLVGVGLYIIGAQINSMLIKRFELRILLKVGLILSVISSFALIVSGFIDVKNPVILQILELPFAFGLAFILPNATAISFAMIKENIGTASAVLGSMEMASGAIGVFLISQLSLESILPIASVMMCLSIVSLALFYLVFKKEIKSREPIK